LDLLKGALQKVDSRSPILILLSFSTYGCFPSKSRSRLDGGERENRSRATRLHFFPTALLICLFHCVCKVRRHGQERMDVPDIEAGSVLPGSCEKFLVVTKKHRLNLKRPRIVCLCNSCKNKLAQEDNVVQSHLVRYGFVKDYTSRVCWSVVPCHHERVTCPSS
jgi:hypothetical protein